jgi:hypothetical protein
MEAICQELKEPPTSCLLNTETIATSGKGEDESGTYYLITLFCLLIGFAGCCLITCYFTQLSMNKLVDNAVAKIKKRRAVAKGVKGL